MSQPDRAYWNSDNFDPMDIAAGRNYVNGYRNPNFVPANPGIRKTTYIGPPCCVGGHVYLGNPISEHPLGPRGDNTFAWCPAREDTLRISEREYLRVKATLDANQPRPVQPSAGKTSVGTKQPRVAGRNRHMQELVRRLEAGEFGPRRKVTAGPPTNTTITAGSPPNQASATTAENKAGTESSSQHGRPAEERRAARPHTPAHRSCID